MVGETAGKELGNEMASLREKVMNLVSILGENFGVETFTEQLDT